MELQEAREILRRYRSRDLVTDVQVVNLLAPTRGVTFAAISYVSQVKTAAAYKDIEILKVAKGNVQLFNNIKDCVDVFANAVKRSATKLGTSLEASVEAFQSQANYFYHTKCHSLVRHRQNESPYLYTFFNSGESLYFINNELATQEQVAQYLTPSERSKLLEHSDTVLNKRYDVEHKIMVRTIALKSIVEIRANKGKVAI
jgi:hypothetical protein